VVMVTVVSTAVMMVARMQLMMMIPGEVENESAMGVKMTAFAHGPPPEFRRKWRK